MECHRRVHINDPERRIAPDGSDDVKRPVQVKVSLVLLGGQ